MGLVEAASEAGTSMHLHAPGERRVLDVNAAEEDGGLQLRASG